MVSLATIGVCFFSVNFGWRIFLFVSRIRRCFMVKRWFSTWIAVCLTVLVSIALTACGGSSTDTPTKLSAPVVTLTENVASWEQDEHADRFEMSIDGSLSYVENTVTSKTLTDGQTFKIRAIGDGTVYTTSEWSNVVTYVASGTPTPQPAKLNTPTVTVSNTGLASWSAVVNASGYAYKLDGGAEVPTSATSLQLADGQSITVKAVGDGTNYTDSDYSAVKTYTAGSTPTPTPTQAPTYLGILASATEPSQSDGLTPFSSGSYNSSTRVSLEQALRTYLSNPANALGDSAPVESEYPVYATIGGTVYIQIWLNNPDQNTILSLKLNGTKHQTGGALQSFFVQDGNSYLNCVYVAVTVPSGAYNEIAYEVTEIEYVEGTNISQDGKAVLIDEDNDTVTIGLPYEENLPTATITNVDTTATQISFTVNVTDDDEFVSTIGGWLRVLIYNQNNEIVAQRKLTAGETAVTFDNLSAETYYNVMVFVLGDAHDGNGVYVHTVKVEQYQTESVLSCQMQPKILQNAQTGKYYPAIDVQATLSDSSFTFTKVEVCEWNYDDNAWKVVYTSAFDGDIEITENVLNEKEYLVKVYYENASSVEQSEQNYVWVQGLDSPRVTYDSGYGLIDDVVLGFNFGDGKYNLDNLTIRIFDEYSKQYLAEDALYLLANSTAIEDLQSQIDAMDWSNPEKTVLMNRQYRLEQVRDKVEEYYPDVEQAEWETELAKGIYMYEYVFGEDDEFFKGAGNTYYVVLEDYQSKRVNDNSWQYIITADEDRNNGESAENRELKKDYFHIKPVFTSGDYMFVASDEDYNELFKVDENNVLYLEVMSKSSSGEESYKALGYVNQIVLMKDDEIVKVLWSQESPNTNVDESAWLAAIRQALIDGDDVNTVFPFGELQPITFDLDDKDIASLDIGKYVIKYTYKMFGKTYSTDRPYDWDGWLDFAVKGQLPTASIAFSTYEFGRFDIVYPESLGSWNDFSIEVRDENEQLIGTYDQDSYWDVQPLSKNYSIRIKLLTYDGHEYYTQDGEWSAWFVCLPITCGTPEGFTQSYDAYGVTVSWTYVDRAEKYVYKLNGGVEQETYEPYISGLRNGDTLVIKAVPSASESNYVESVYSLEYTVVDNRPALSAPVVTFDSYYQTLEWTAIDNAAKYVVYNVTNDSEQELDASSTSCTVQLGYEYIVRAVPNDSQTYVASQSAIIDTTVKLTAPEITIVDGAVSFSDYPNVVGKVTYTYVINDGEEQTTRNASGVITLNDGDTIKVKVSISRAGYVESEWSTATYTVA